MEIDRNELIKISELFSKYEEVQEKKNKINSKNLFEQKKILNKLFSKQFPELAADGITYDCCDQLNDSIIEDISSWLETEEVQKACQDIVDVYNKDYNRYAKEERNFLREFCKEFAKLLYEVASGKGDEKTCNYMNSIINSLKSTDDNNPISSNVFWECERMVKAYKESFKNIFNIIDQMEKESK